VALDERDHNSDRDIEDNYESSEIHAGVSSCLVLLIHFTEYLILLGYISVYDSSDIRNFVYSF
jgi:hypothetical protein